MMDVAMKTFAISDIHGCYIEFIELLGKMNIDFVNDQMIILGDLIDRGPQSDEVVRKVMAMQAEYGTDHVTLLRGNHEQMAVDYYSTGDRGWDYNGNDATINSFLRSKDDVQNYLDYFRQLPLLYQDESTLFVHAGIDPGCKLTEQDERDLLNIRQTFYNSRKTFPKTVVFGHTPTLFMTGRDYPVIMADRIGIDTGCVYGGSLTGLEVKEGKVQEVFQVKKKF